MKKYDGWAKKRRKDSGIMMKAKVLELRDGMLKVWIKV